MITGSSTHNQRIERLWRDVHRCVTSLFHRLFHMLEDEGLLDCLNEVDMFCLQYAFLDRINSALTSFIESWNNHSTASFGNEVSYFVYSSCLKFFQNFLITEK